MLYNVEKHVCTQKHDKERFQSHSNVKLMKQKNNMVAIKVYLIQLNSFSSLSTSKAKTKDKIRLNIIRHCHLAKLRTLQILIASETDL